MRIVNQPVEDGIGRVGHGHGTAVPAILVGNPLEARKHLLAKIVDRVFVYDKTALAVALHGDFSIVLDNGTSAPHEVVEGLNVEINRGKEKGANGINSTCTLDGSDGPGYLSGHKCIVLPSSMNRPIFIQHLLKHYKIGHGSL